MSYVGGGGGELLPVSAFDLLTCMMLCIFLTLRGLHCLKYMCFLSCDWFMKHGVASVKTALSAVTALKVFQWNITALYKATSTSLRTFL